MQLHKLVLGSTLTIAAITTQSAAWSSTPNHSSYEVSTEIQQELQPGTSGGADSQSLDSASKDRSNPPESPVLDQSANNTNPEMKSLNSSKDSSTSCQLFPQTTGGNALKQLDSISGCNLSN